MSMDWKDDVIQAYNEHCKYLGNMLAEESKFKFQLMDVITNMETNIKSLTETLNNTRSLLETCQEKLKEINPDNDSIFKLSEFYFIDDDLVQIGQKILEEQKQNREKRNKETIENAKEWYEITCPSCGKTYKCTYQDSGTHCYNYITEDGIEIVGTIESEELECPNCHEWYKEDKWNFKEL